MREFEIIDSILDFCPICGEKHNISICKEEKKAVYKSQEVIYKNIFYLCENTPEDSENGNTYYPGLLLDENMLRLKDNYRLLHNLLQSKDIVNLRNFFNLSQNDLSILLGFSNNRIKDLEIKKIQTQEENKKLVFLKNKIFLVKNLLLKTNNDLLKTSKLIDNHFNNIKITESKANVFDVSSYILDKVGKITTMKLQKLCFYSYVWSLILDKNKLFSENIYAWDNGPVIKELFKIHKGKYILTEISGDINNINSINKETIDVILKIYNNLSAEALSEKTHSESPWQNTKRNEIITDNEILNYYSNVDLKI